MSIGVCINTQGWQGVKMEWMEVKSIIDLVLVKKDMLRYVQDVKAVKRMG